MRGRRAAAAWAAVLLAEAAVPLAGTAGCAPAAARPAPAAEVLTVAAVGDSVTEADSADFDDGDIGELSWATSATDAGVRVVGGWAHAGATTGDVLAGVTDRVAGGQFPRVDVVVVMAGSNDVDVDAPFEQSAADLEALVRTVQPARVVFSTIPPEDAVAAGVQAFNARLADLARSAGWQLVDPMAGVGDGAGHWLPGMSDDGMHPSARGARLIGRALHSVLSSERG
ncbi:SGNH/GDSL hydrolase family protein [Geodermatophilus sp. TF02-6]|uniref:SGNH/GDSL hydrolase family protein n=1 Tax=Geodermatophilus sp. TF02-6 TaxID=2250575 RepID=UPI0013149909|nr:SGNH/GDSL hydrolase family protein [Geodermatophilus sp. TF02-6]